MKFYTVLVILLNLGIYSAFSQESLSPKTQLNINGIVYQTDHRGESSGLSIEAILPKQLFLGFGIRYLHNQAWIPVFPDYIKIGRRMYASKLPERFMYDFKIGKNINNSFFSWGSTNIYYRLSVMKSMYRNNISILDYYDTVNSRIHYKTFQVKYPNVWSIDNGIGINHKAKLYENLSLNIDLGLGIIYYNGIDYNELTRHAVRGSYQLGLGFSYQIQ